MSIALATADPLPWPHRLVNPRPPEPTPMPTSVKVGPYRYTVVQDTERIAALTPECDPSPLGLLNLETGEIVIHSSLTGRRAAAILLHEVIHAVIFNIAIVDEDDEEALVILLTNALLSLFDDNPQLVPHLEESA